MATNNAINATLPVINKIATQYITSVGAFTYTPTTGMKYCIVQGVAAGGAGGGVPSSGTNNQAGSGGSAGATGYVTLTAAQVGVSQTGSIGAGGTGVSGANGGNGGNTTLGTFLSLTGGIGGNADSAATTAAHITSGVSGSSGTAGDLILLGGDGGRGVVFGSNIAWGGAGGISNLWGHLTNNSVVSSGQLAGLNSVSAPGCGGSGAASLATTGALAGGNGNQGLIMITEFISV